MPGVEAATGPRCPKRRPPGSGKTLVQGAAPPVRAPLPLPVAYAGPGGDPFAPRPAAGHLGPFAPGAVVHHHLGLGVAVPVHQFEQDRGVAGRQAYAPVRRGLAEHADRAGAVERRAAMEEDRSGMGAYSYWREYPELAIPEGLGRDLQLFGTETEDFRRATADDEMTCTFALRLRSQE